MLHKCRLLKDQNQLNEFAACGLEMLSYYFRHVYYAKNLRGTYVEENRKSSFDRKFRIGICLYSCRKARQEMRKGATGSGEETAVRKISGQESLYPQILCLVACATTPRKPILMQRIGGNCLSRFSLAPLCSFFL